MTEAIASREWPTVVTDETDKTSRRDDAPAWIEGALLAALDGRLWHATDEKGWAGIRASGTIRPDAPPHYANGFCRSIGAVSLFDLRCPDSACSPAAAHWSDWLGHRADEPRYWIEVNRARTVATTLTPAETLDRWRTALAAGASSLRIIAGIESAHLGCIPMSSTVQLLTIRDGRWLKG